MNWFIEKIYDIAVKHFHKWYGLTSAILLLLTISLLAYRLIPENEIIFRDYIYGISFLEIILFVLWLFYVYYYPRRSREKLGFAIAIYIEDSESSKLFKKDFIAPLKSKIEELRLPFDVLSLKNHQSEKVDTVEDARKILRKTKSQFCIWGSIKKRKNVPEGQRYIFSVRGIVVHKPLQEVQKILLQKEFNVLLPNRFIFEENLQFEKFEFRSNQVLVALDYITGRAALLSGDYNTAIILHSSLYKSIENGEFYPINKEIVKNLLSIEYEFKASVEYKIKKISCADSIKQSLKYNKNNYGALLKKAIIEFNNGKGDPLKALDTINHAKDYSGAGYEWLYSKAFLYFWLEDYPKAIKCCDKLKEKNYEGENVTIKEVIDFNENLLKKFNKPQLYYWLGFVAFVKDKKASLADGYFQKFIDKSDSSMEELIIRAKSYLANTKKEIGY